MSITIYENDTIIIGSSEIPFNQMEKLFILDDPTVKGEIFQVSIKDKQSVKVALLEMRFTSWKSTASKAAKVEAQSGKIQSQAIAPPDKSLDQDSFEKSGEQNIQSQAIAPPDKSYDDDGFDESAGADNNMGFLSDMLKKK